ncbi:MAG: hypothetical protein ACRDK2_10450 [Solirubrobacteraceae bacterium]
MQLDRQNIEKRDFPITRKGYDPAAVDAHLRALADAVQELEASVGQRSEQSLASSAGARVQSILQAAQASAADLERQANDEARAVRARALAQANAHVQAVSTATAALASQVQSMDGEVDALLKRLRVAGDRLDSDLAMPEGSAGSAVPASSPELIDDSTQPQELQVPSVPASQEPEETDTALEPAQVEDLDGARLVALNMALNGESRQDTERYLSQNFGLSESAQLLDEVYAAIEG